MAASSRSPSRRPPARLAPASGRRRTARCGCGSRRPTRRSRTTGWSRCWDSRVDHRPFLEVAAADPLLRPMRGRLTGMRPWQLSSPEHALVRAISGQLIRASEAIRIERRILRDVCPPFGDMHLPVDAAMLAGAHPARFERAGLSPARAVLLKRAAKLPWGSDGGRAERPDRRPPARAPWARPVDVRRHPAARLRALRAGAGRRSGADPRLRRAARQTGRASRTRSACWSPTASGAASPPRGYCTIRRARGVRV